jgi:hypothetical protein
LPSITRRFKIDQTFLEKEKNQVMRVGSVTMFVLVRAVTYSALFMGFVLVYLPGRFLSWSGIVAPATTGAPQIAGMIIVTIGTLIAFGACLLSCSSAKACPRCLIRQETHDPWAYRVKRWMLRKVRSKNQEGGRRTGTPNAQRPAANDTGLRSATIPYAELA